MWRLQFHLYGVDAPPQLGLGLMARAPYDQFLASDFAEVRHDINGQVWIYECEASDMDSLSRFRFDSFHLSFPSL